MKKTNKIISIIAAAVALSLGLAVFAQAASITFPIAALGNCASKQDCKAYCDQPTNQPACIAFAQQNGLISQQQAEQEQKVTQAVQGGGPGGCTSQQACMAYCNDVSHLQECTSFGKEHGIISQEQEDESSSFQKAISSGTKMPGGCTTLNECQSYCLQSAHINECVSFGEKSGLIPQDKISQLKKMVNLIQSGQTPGGCKTGEECKTYCSDPAHADECASFGQKIGALTSDQAKQLQFQMRQQFQGQPIPQCPQQNQQSDNGQTNQPGRTQCGPPMQGTQNPFGQQGQNGDQNQQQFGHMVQNGQGQEGEANQAPPCPAGQQCQTNLDNGNKNIQPSPTHCIGMHCGGGSPPEQGQQQEQEQQGPEQPEQTEPPEQENQDQQNPGAQVQIPLPPLPFLQQQPQNQQNNIAQ